MNMNRRPPTSTRIVRTFERSRPDPLDQDRAHVQQREALALGALLRVRSRLRRHDRHVAASATRLGQPLAQEGRLNAAPSMVRERRGAAQLRDAVRDPQAAAAGGLAVAPRKIPHEAIHFLDVLEDVVEGLPIDDFVGRRGVERVGVQEARDDRVAPERRFSGRDSRNGDGGRHAGR